MRDTIQIAEDLKNDKIRYINRSVPEVQWEDRSMGNQFVSQLMSKEEADTLAERINAKKIGTFVVVESRQPETKGQYRVVINTKTVTIKELDMDEKKLVVAFLNEVYGSYMSSFVFINTQWKLSVASNDIVYVGPSVNYEPLFLEEGFNIRDFIFGRSESRSQHSCRAEVIELAQNYILQESGRHGAAYSWTKGGILALNEIRVRYQSENTAGSSATTSAAARRYGEFFTAADTGAAASAATNTASSSDADDHHVKTGTP